MKVFSYVTEWPGKQNILNCRLHLGRTVAAPFPVQGEGILVQYLGTGSQARQKRGPEWKSSVKGRGWSRELYGSWRMWGTIEYPGRIKLTLVIHARGKYLCDQRVYHLSQIPQARVSIHFLAAFAYMLRWELHGLLCQERQNGILTLETFIADADGAGGAVPVPTAELGASLSDVHVVNCPALLLRFFALLDPAKLGCTESPTESRRDPGGCYFPGLRPASSLWEWGLFLRKGLPKLLPEASNWWRWVVYPSHSRSIYPKSPENFTWISYSVP